MNIQKRSQNGPNFKCQILNMLGQRTHSEAMPSHKDIIVIIIIITFVISFIVIIINDHYFFYLQHHITYLILESSFL